MNFEETAAVLTPFFEQHNFSIAESSKHYIAYELNDLHIAVSYDARERSISVYIEQGGKHVAELSDNTIANFFKDDTKLRNDSLFTENLFKFLNGKGNPLLKGDLNTLSELKEFTNRIAKENFDNAIKKQQLIAADDAWSRKDYGDFISHLSKISNVELSKTYLMKYQYALRKKSQ